MLKTGRKMINVMISTIIGIVVLMEGTAVDIIQLINIVLIVLA